MQIGSVAILDEFAEAFRMWAARLIVTAADRHWLTIAANVVTGYGTSVIGCDAEAGVERWLSPDHTLDGRPGVSILLFAFNAKALTKSVPNRVGQCLITCPTVAVYDGMPGLSVTEDSARIEVGSRVRYFGDGFQKSKVLVHDGIARRYWRIPIMEGECVCEASVGAAKAIGGGNLLVCGRDQASALAGAQRAVDAVAPLCDVITPFPGGIVRSGSKVGSRYKALFASSNDAWCPTLRGRTKSLLPPDVGAVYEIVINGLSQGAIAHAMRVAVEAACTQPGVIAIGAGNYGGNLGKFHFHLHKLFDTPAVAPPVPPTPVGGYTLTWKGMLAPGSGEALRPDTLGALSPDELAKQTLSVGRQPVALAELFDIAGSPGPVLTLKGLPALPRLGATMAAGELHIHGHAGDELGASMRGGLIRVRGRAGHRVGGPAPGSDRGMTGGEIVIDGDCGDHAGLRMRRGLIAIAGSAGKSPGFRMLAGTLVIGRGPVPEPGLEMRRGTILCLDAQQPATLAGGFRHDHTFAVSDMVALRLVLRRLSELGFGLNLQGLAAKTALYSGDAMELNKGELWQWVC
jgi:formylmethanofuran--tetrahydromethanopterin N-formyltransferase